MSNILFLIFLSFLPVFLVGRYIYKHDEDKDSKKILFKLFMAGIASAFVAVIFSLTIQSILGLTGETTDMNLLQIFIYAFVVVAFSEELAKWFFTYSIGYKSKYFDRPFEIILYSVFVALGFAAFENILYVFGNETFGQSIFVGVIRSITAIPAHAIDGIFMGYFLSLAKQAEVKMEHSSKKKYLFLSLLVPIFLHGLYDFLAFSGHKSFIFIILFFIVLVLLYIIGFSKIKKVSKIKERLFYKNNFCHKCGSKVVTDFCQICGNKNA